MVPLFDADKRCLLYSSSRRTSDDTTLRDPTVTTSEGAEIPIIWAKHTDEGRDNGLISPCNAIILICCGGGGGCHNNIQHVHKGGMGNESYIAKYVGKGVGQLVQCLS